MDAMSRRAFAPRGTELVHVERPSAALAQEFLDRARGASRTPAPTVGRGQWRVLSGSVIGGELIDRGRIAHLAVFAA